MHLFEIPLQLVTLVLSIYFGVLLSQPALTKGISLLRCHGCHMTTTLLT